MRWFCHIVRKNNEEFEKKVYISEIVEPRRGRQVGRWKDRIKEHMYERVINREGWTELARRVFG